MRTFTSRTSSEQSEENPDGLPLESQE